MKCQAEQVSDQMHCIRCKQCWDMNDHSPPQCIPSASGLEASTNSFKAGLWERINIIWRKKKQFIDSDNVRGFFWGVEYNGKIYLVG